MTVILALPAYNEEEGLPDLIASFTRVMQAGAYAHRIVIVDDGSSDGTVEVIRRCSTTTQVPIHLRKHEQNRGLGDTIRDALSEALSIAGPDDIIVTMDSDNTHSPELIPSMLQLVKAGKDVVIASRYRTGSQVVGLQSHRHLMSYGARFLFQIVFPISGVRDYTCGFRAYRVSVLGKALAHYGDGFVTERGFACMAEILLNMAKSGATMAEVPMVLRYDWKKGASKMRVFRTVSKTLRMMARKRFS